MTTYSAHGPGPVWHTEDKAPPYPDGRFDGPFIPDASTPVWGSEMGIDPPTTERQLRVRIITLEHELTIKQKQVELFASEIVEYSRIYNAARLAADDMESVLRLWPYPVPYPLNNLRALLMLMQPATEAEE